MKVKVCQCCEFFKRRTYSTYYVPKNYHPIGMSHVYGYCSFHNKRVSDVKKCENYNSEVKDDEQGKIG